MIEVFKTNVDNHEKALEIIREIEYRFGYRDVVFDLEDCDKILRIDSENLVPQNLISFLNNMGVHCEVLPD